MSGSVCSAELIKYGHEVIVIDDLSTGHREYVPVRYSSSMRWASTMLMAFAHWFGNGQWTRSFTLLRRL